MINLHYHRLIVNSEKSGYFLREADSTIISHGFNVMMAVKGGKIGQITHKGLIFKNSSAIQVLKDGVERT